MGQQALKKTQQQTKTVDNKTDKTAPSPAVKKSGSTIATPQHVKSRESNYQNKLKLVSGQLKSPGSGKKQPEPKLALSLKTVQGWMAGGDAAVYEQAARWAFTGLTAVSDLKYRSLIKPFFKGWLQIQQPLRKMSYLSAMPALGKFANLEGAVFPRLYAFFLRDMVLPRLDALFNFERTLRESPSVQQLDRRSKLLVQRKALKSLKIHLPFLGGAKDFPSALNSAFVDEGMLKLALIGGVGRAHQNMLSAHVVKATTGKNIAPAGQTQYLLRTLETDPEQVNLRKMQKNIESTCRNIALTKRLVKKHLQKIPQPRRAAIQQQVQTVGKHAHEAWSLIGGYPWATTNPDKSVAKRIWKQMRFHLTRFLHTSERLNGELYRLRIEEINQHIDQVHRSVARWQTALKVARVVKSLSGTAVIAMAGAVSGPGGAAAIGALYRASETAFETISAQLFGVASFNDSYAYAKSVRQTLLKIGLAGAKGAFEGLAERFGRGVDARVNAFLSKNTAKMAGHLLKSGGTLKSAWIKSLGAFFFGEMAKDAAGIPANLIGAVDKWLLLVKQAKQSGKKVPSLAAYLKGVLKKELKSLVTEKALQNLVKAGFKGRALKKDAKKAATTAKDTQKALRQNRSSQVQKRITGLAAAKLGQYTNQVNAVLEKQFDALKQRMSGQLGGLNTAHFSKAFVETIKDLAGPAKLVNTVGKEIVKERAAAKRAKRSTNWTTVIKNSFVELLKEFPKVYVQKLAQAVRESGANINKTTIEQQVRTAVTQQAQNITSTRVTLKSLGQHTQ